MRRPLSVAVLGVLLAWLVAHPVAAQDVRRLLRQQAEVSVKGAGLHRMPLPAEVLSAVATDLSDLRIFDRDGHEVPYFLDAGLPLGWERRAEQTIEAQVLDVSREELPREGRKSLAREVYRLRFPEAPPTGDGWTLIVQSAQSRFVSSIEIRGEQSDGSLTVLVPRASLVRLGQSGVDRNQVALPQFAGPSLILSVEGEDGFYLEPTFRFASGHVLPATDTLEVPLPILATRRESGRTFLELGRPPGLMPQRLRLTTSTIALDRSWVAYDTTPAGEIFRLGEGRIVKAAAVGGVDSLEMPIGVARGDKLRLEIADRESPPLVDLSVTALVQQPNLVFALPAAGGEGSVGVLLFGGGRAWRPQYDLVDLLARATSSGIGGPADTSQLPQATLGPVRPNAAFDPRPALAAVLQAGQSLADRKWRWHRRLTIPNSPEGVVKLQLAADDVAHALPTRADLRVVDGEGRQWPYLEASTTTREPTSLSFERGRHERGQSSWHLVLPAAPLALDRLVLSPARPVLARPYRLLLRQGQADARVLSEGTLRQDLQRPMPIRITFQTVAIAGSRDLTLVVEDGDDAPLELARVEAPLELPVLLLAAPPGEYVLLAGNPDVESPRYELARVREMILGLQKGSAVPGEGTEIPDWQGVAGGSAASRDRVQQVAVWGTIGLAVVVLGWLTLRVARRED